MQHSLQKYPRGSRRHQEMGAADHQWQSQKSTEAGINETELHSVDRESWLNLVIRSLRISDAFYKS